MSRANNLSVMPTLVRPVMGSYTLEPSLGLLLLQPSMEGDKKLCKASFVAQPLGHAASTLAQSIGMDLTRSLHGCRNFYLLILSSLSFSLSFSLFLLLLILDRTDVCSPLLRLFPTQFRAKMDFSRKKEKKNTYCVVTVTPPSLQGLHA